MRGGQVFVSVYLLRDIHTKKHMCMSVSLMRACVCVCVVGLWYVLCVGNKLAVLAGCSDKSC